MNVHSFFIVALLYNSAKMKSNLKSNSKRESLLVNNNGFHATPMSKIAKMAGVSPGTIYLYFENKQDLVNQVYIEVKRSFTRFAFKDYKESTSVEGDFEKIWKNIAEFKLKEVEEALFLSQCDNTPMIDEPSRKEGLKHLSPLLELWKRGQKEGLIKQVSPYLLYAFSIYPISFLLQQRERFEIKPENINEAYEMAWNSIKI